MIGSIFRRLGPYWRDVEDARIWAEWCKQHGGGPALTVGLVVDDPSSPPLAALEAARRIEAYGATVRFVGTGTHY